MSDVSSETPPAEEPARSSRRLSVSADEVELSRLARRGDSHGSDEDSRESEGHESGPAEAGPDETDQDETALVPGRISHLPSAGLAAIFGLLLTATAQVSALALLCAIGVVQAILILCWVFASTVPGRWGVIVLAGAAAAGADVAASVSPHGQLGALLPVVGFAVPLMFAHQLMRGLARSRVVESLANIAVLIAAVVSIVALLQLRHEMTGEDVAGAVAAAAGLALVVGHLTDFAFPIARFDPDVSRGLVAVLAGAIAGAAISFLMLHDMIEFQNLRSAFLGFAVGLVASLFAVGTGFIQQSSPPAPARTARLRPVYGVLMPLCFTAPIGFLLCLAIRG